MSLTTQERRELIMNAALESGHVSVRKLAFEMNVSEATVRRDLRTLSDRGRLELVYGGASLPRTADFSIQSRTELNVEAKRTIGKLAADFVPNGETLFIDSGTTCYEMRHHLKRKQRLSIIVNSARLAVELGASPDVSVIQLGGHYRAERMDTVGPLAAGAIDELRGYVAFIGADGLGVEFGLTAVDIETAYLYKHVMKNARETILLVDHTKFLTPSLFRIADIREVSRVITDRAPSEEWTTFLNECGIDLIYPGHAGGDSDHDN